jgi:hypothetical protein
MTERGGRLICWLVVAQADDDNDDVDAGAELFPDGGGGEADDGAGTR